MKSKVKLGIIGLGARGTGLLKYEFLRMKDVEIIGVCDLFQDRVQAAISVIKKRTGKDALGFSDYKELIELPELNGVVIISSWESHIPIALECMQKGIFVGLEVGGAYSVKDCWDLVDTYEKTKTPCMFLENCCYGEVELALSNMVRQGVLGEIVHCSGGYMHDLRKEIVCGNQNRHYRLRNYINRNCENYPTHELGPIAKILNINNGNRLVSLSSFSSKSAGLSQYVASKNIEELRNTAFKQGDIITTVIKCENGETIVLTLDTTLPRPYSRGFTIKGTKGMYQEDGNYFFLDNDIVHRAHHEKQKKLWNNAKKYLRKYRHPLWKTRRELNIKGHGGMDTLIIKAMVDTIKNGGAPPIDIYDAALWMSITPLSEQSIASGSAPIEIPDFTRGRYKSRKDICKSKYSLD